MAVTAAEQDATKIASKTDEVTGRVGDDVGKRRTFVVGSAASRLISDETEVALSAAAIERVSPETIDTAGKYLEQQLGPIAKPAGRKRR